LGHYNGLGKERIGLGGCGAGDARLADGEGQYNGLGKERIGSEERRVCDPRLVGGSTRTDWERNGSDRKNAAREIRG
jgi:hypothetical protein